MRSQAKLFKIVRSIGSITIALYCLSLFPSPAFDACTHGSSAFVCGQWPDLLMGALFVTICYFAGPKNKIHYIFIFVFYLFLGSAENIRFGSYHDAIYQAPFQEFYYGGIISVLLIASFFTIKSKV
jgi:hypothetical protein